MDSSVPLEIAVSIIPKHRFSSNACPKGMVLKFEALINRIVVIKPALFNNRLKQSIRQVGVELNADLYRHFVGKIKQLSSRRYRH